VDWQVFPRLLDSFCCEICQLSSPASAEFDNGKSINWFFYAISIDNVLPNIIMDVLDKKNVDWKVLPRLLDSFCCEICLLSAPASTEFDNGESINWFFYAISIHNVLPNTIVDVLDKILMEWQVFQRLFD